MPLSIHQPPAPSFTKRLLFVIQAWWRQPAEVATICPSSPYLTEKIADRDCIREADTVLELGPGAGGTTTAMLKQIHPASRLLAIEKTPAFRKALDAIADPRLTFEIGDAVNMLSILEDRGFGQPDVIVSGIPFSALPSATAETIVQSIHAALRPGGTFIAYQVRSDIEQYAQPLFGASKCEVVALNLPPLRVFEWQKAVQTAHEDDCQKEVATKKFATK